MTTNKLDLTLGKKTKKVSKQKRSEAIWGYICVAPLTIGLLMFLFAPLLFSLYVSLTEYDLFNDPVFVGMKNFEFIFNPKTGVEFWNSIGNAFVMCIGTLISIVLSLIIASILCGKIKFADFFKSVFFLPTICSSVAVTFMWKRMFDYNYGTLNFFVKSILGFEEGIFWLSEENVVGSLMFMTILFGFGTSMLLYISAIKGIPSSYYEAAEMDGANTFQKFFCSSSIIEILGSSQFF